MSALRKLLSRLVGQMDMWQNVINARGYDMAIEAHESVGLSSSCSTESVISRSDPRPRALESAGHPDLGSGDPRLWVAEGGQLSAPA
jgi:hypothetical protein